MAANLEDILFPAFRPRRSVLYVPASNGKALAKIPALACDTVILDLEDAVAPEGKLQARENARAFLEAGGANGKECVVRVNGFAEDSAPDFDLLADDLATVLPCEPDGILFPKIRTPADVHRAQSAVMHHYATSKTSLWLMLETPQAILEAAGIARQLATQSGARGALVLGTNDLAKEMRLPRAATRLALLQALSQCVLAARAFGLDVIDGVYGQIGDLAGFEAECAQGRTLGFDGKSLIHPEQIATANRLFSPSNDEIREALAIVEAFEVPQNAGAGVITVEGRMTERLHYIEAKRVLALVGQG